jgi:hypothetical protein
MTLGPSARLRTSDHLTEGAQDEPDRGHRCDDHGKRIEERKLPHDLGGMTAIRIAREEQIRGAEVEEKIVEQRDEHERNPADGAAMLVEPFATENRHPFHAFVDPMAE